MHYLLIFSRKSPEGFTALVSTGDGNCMYNSVSILFHGSERCAAHLRLLSVIHALDHFDHYVTMVAAYSVTYTVFGYVSLLPFLAIS